MMNELAAKATKERNARRTIGNCGLVAMAVAVFFHGKETVVRGVFAEAANETVCSKLPESGTTRPAHMPALLTSVRGQAKASRTAKSGLTFNDCEGGWACPEMVVMPPGTFTMGSPASESGRYKDEDPQHLVKLKAFAGGKFDVTRAEYALFVRETGRAAGGKCYKIDQGGNWAEDAGTTWENPGFPQSATDPAVCVSWQDATDYAAWLSKKTGRGYRLPTESEWEYAARAGTTTPFFWGTTIGKGHANCRTCGSQWDSKQPAPVGSFPPNAFGLFDMAGNVWQWVADCYVPNYLKAPSDGSAVTAGDCSKRVMRGAGWYQDKPEDLRSASRGGGQPTDRGSNLGFRVARTL